MCYIGAYLGVEHDCAHDARLAAGCPQVVQGGLVVLVASVREVKAGNVHATPQHLAQDGDAASRGEEGGKVAGR